MEPMSLAATDTATAAGVLARAFDDDPGILYILPDAEMRAALLPGMFSAIVRHGLLRGEVLGLEQPTAAVSIWLPPGRAELLDEAGMAEAGMPEAMANWDAGAQERSGILVRYLGGLHARLMPEAHAYLSFLGVEPARQGQGLGGNLLQPKLQQLKTNGMPAYLETLKVRNVPFYERHGFRVLEHSVVPATDVPVWAMRAGGNPA